MKTIIRIILTFLVLLFLLPTIMVFQLFLADTIRYEYSNPPQAMLKELENIFEITLPEDMKVSMISKGSFSFSSEQLVEFRVHSNLKEEQWQQVFGEEMKRTVGYTTTAIVYHARPFAFKEDARGYISFELPARDLFVAYNYMNADNENDTNYMLGNILLLAGFGVIVLIIWFPYENLIEKIMDPTGEKRMFRADFSIPEWVKEAEREEAEKALKEKL